MACMGKLISSVGLEVLEEVLAEDDDHAQADEHAEHEHRAEDVAREGASSHRFHQHPYGRVV